MFAKLTTIISKVAILIILRIEVVFIDSFIVTASNIAITTTMNKA